MAFSGKWSCAWPMPACWTSSIRRCCSNGPLSCGSTPVDRSPVFGRTWPVAGPKTPVAQAMPGDRPAHGEGRQWTHRQRIPQKVRSGAQIRCYLILINGLVAIGLHNGGPPATTRRAKRCAGEFGGEQLTSWAHGARRALGRCAPRRCRPGRFGRLRLRGWGRNRQDLTAAIGPDEWGTLEPAIQLTPQFVVIHGVRGFNSSMTC